MDYSVTFARHYSRLVWLLLNEPNAIDEQKASLRAIVTVSREGPVTIETRDFRLVVNGAILPDALTGVQDLAAQLVGHAIASLVVDKGAAPADLLGLARILAAEPVPGDAGRMVHHKLERLGARTVHVALVDPSQIGRATPLGVPAIAEPDDTDLAFELTEEHAVPRPSLSAEAASAQPAAVPAAPVPRAESSSAPGGPRTPGSLPGVPGAEGMHGDGAYLMFAAVQLSEGSNDERFKKLDETRSVNGTTRLLDELVTIAENAQRDGKFDVVAAIFFGIVQREAQHTDAEMKRAYVMAVRRMSKPTLLRAVAGMLPKRKDREEEYMTVLSRTGEDGADALIEHLVNAQTVADRRVFFNMLTKLKSGVPTLVHMLGDARWFVARNAADLLGELQAVDAEGALCGALKHNDDRVRRAAAAALSRFGTARSLKELREALRDPSAQVRMQAAVGLSSQKGARSATTLVRALDEETDSEVQLTIIAALGRMATPDAVQKLIKAAEPAAGFFKKKPPALRVAAVQALGESRTPAAVAALQALLNDKDKEVREAVFRTVMSTQTSTGTTPTSGPVVS